LRVERQPRGGRLHRHRRPRLGAHRFTGRPAIRLCSASYTAGRLVIWVWPLQR
jgi:hypothetical protein